MKILIAISMLAIVSAILVWRRFRDPYYLARAGNVKALQARLQLDPSLLGAKDRGGETILMHAAKYGHLELVDILLRAGVDPNATCEGGGNALMFVSHFGFPDIAKRLIVGGAKVGATDADGVSALHYAACAGRDAVVAVLLESGADRTLQTKAGTTAVDDARKMGHQVVISRLEKTT
jgi:ankyrin repeat protein